MVRHAVLLVVAVIILSIAGCRKESTDEQESLHALLKQIQGDYKDSVKKLQEDVTELGHQQVPIGCIVAWRPRDASEQPPDGYKICRKYEEDDKTTPFDETQIPDLTDRFIKGKSKNSAIGSEGGTNDFPKHTHVLADNIAPLVAVIGGGRGDVESVGKANFNPGRGVGKYGDETRGAVPETSDSKVVDWRPAHVNLYYIIRVK